MNETTVRVSARCDDCQRVYRVPKADRTYRCKGCGGTVHVVEGSEEPHEPVPSGTVTCYECEAINPGGLEYCAECGSSLDFTPPKPGNHAAAKLRQEASDALKSATRWINGVMILYRVGAVAYAIATLFAILALARTEVPREAGVLVVALTTMLSVLLLMGALHILFRPFAWTIAIAVLATAVSVVHYVGPDPLGVAFLASAAWALVAWAALIPTHRAQKLIATHKDLYILHHASRHTRHSLLGHTGQERHERLLRAMRRAARRTWKLSTAAAGGICLASILATGAVLAQARPQELTPSVERFVASWNAGDLEAVNEAFDPRVRKVESLRLKGLLRGYGWLETLPQLADGKQRFEDDQVFIDYPLGDIAATAQWTMVGTEWRLLRVELPIPRLRPELDRFVEAWHASDPIALAGFFASDKQSEMLANLRNAAEGRAWTEYPRIRSMDLVHDSRGRATATFELDEGELGTEWHFRLEGQWRMHTLRLPKR